MHASVVMEERRGCASSFDSFEKGRAERKSRLSTFFGKRQGSRWRALHSKACERADLAPNEVSEMEEIIKLMQQKGAPPLAFACEGSSHRTGFSFVPGAKSLPLAVKLLGEQIQEKKLTVNRPLIIL
jgi:hypothetical protein